MTWRRAARIAFWVWFGLASCIAAGVILGFTIAILAT